MEFGQTVHCTAYIKPSGNFYEVNPAKNNEDDFPECYFWAAGAEKGVEVEDFHVCDRFKTVQADFTGLFVGLTTLNTKITAEYFDGPYVVPYFRTQTENPAQFALVYYASNKKRLVPLDAITAAEGRCNDG